VLLFPLSLWANLSDSAPPPPPMLWKMVLPDILHCRFVQRHVGKILRHFQNPHFQALLIMILIAAL
jgi:hypothetical protein